GCGNGRVDRADPADPNDTGEVCDDGNERSGDGCSSDCRSNETCGNGVTDPIHMERCDDGDRISNDGCDSQCSIERPRWRELVLDPAQRTAAAIAYDIARDRVVLFGGADPLSVLSNETWEWNGAGWIRMTPPQAPSMRAGAAMAYDAARR